MPRVLEDEGDWKPILRMSGISKSFPGVDALRDVSITVRRGDVLGLIERPTPPRMIELGVAVIYQEMMIAPHLTVAENLFLGCLPHGRLGLVDWAAAGKRSTEIMARLGFRVDPRARLDTLSVAQRQMVEIARALTRNARLVILDEPSGVLGPPPPRGAAFPARRPADQQTAHEPRGAANGHRP